LIIGFMSKKAEGLELDSDRSFQEKFWVVERVGWALMFLIVVAALAGFTGVTGAASSGRAEAAGAKIDHPRISRWQTADTLAVEFHEGAAGKVEVLIPKAFTKVFAIEGVTPEPSKVTATPEGQLFEFELAAESGEKTADFALRAGRPALPTQARGAVAGEPFDMPFTVLP
jgi:hypothetical protein